MKGPNPVCTSARKNANQSSPRVLAREGGAGGSTGAGSGGGGASAALPFSTPCASSRPRRRGEGAAVSLHLRHHRDARRQRAQHHDRLSVLVFGRRAHLIAGQV